MAQPKPSAARPAAIVAAVLLLAALFGPEDPRAPFRFPDRSGAKAGKRSEPEAASSGLPGGEASRLPRDARDAPAALAPWEVERLRAGATDWNVAGAGVGATLTVARRDASGRVLVSRAPAAPAFYATRFAPRARVNAKPGRESRTWEVAEPRPARRRAALRRSGGSPTAKGHAAEGGEDELELEVWEPEPPAPSEVADPGSGSLGRRLASWFGALRERQERRRARRARKVRLSLKQLLGAGVLRPPKGKLEAPDFSKLGAAPKLPKSGTDWPRLTPSELEKVKPPDTEPGYRDWYRDSRSNRGHWHPGEAGEYFHQPGAWGLLLEGPRWAWLPKSGDRWWAEGPRAPMVWHARHWWWRTEDGWFLLHRGQAWAYRFFQDLERDGIIEPNSGAKVVYSADGRRAAIVIPGKETIVYDVETGEIVGRLPAD